MEHSAIAAAVVKLAFPRVHNPAARSKRFSAAAAFLTGNRTVLKRRRRLSLITYSRVDRAHPPIDEEGRSVFPREPAVGQSQSLDSSSGNLEDPIEER